MSGDLDQIINALAKGISEAVKTGQEEAGAAGEGRPINVTIPSVVVNGTSGEVKKNPTSPRSSKATAPSDSAAPKSPVKWAYGWYPIDAASKPGSAYPGPPPAQTYGPGGPYNAPHGATPGGYAAAPGVAGTPYTGVGASKSGVQGRRKSQVLHPGYFGVDAGRRNPTVGKGPQVMHPAYFMEGKPVGPVDLVDHPDDHARGRRRSQVVHPAYFEGKVPSTRHFDAINYPEDMPQKTQILHPTYFEGGRSSPRSSYPDYKRPQSPPMYGNPGPYQSQSQYPGPHVATAQNSYPAYPPPEAILPPGQAPPPVSPPPPGLDVHGGSAQWTQDRNFGQRKDYYRGRDESPRGRGDNVYSRRDDIDDFADRWERRIEGYRSGAYPDATGYKRSLDMETQRERERELSRRARSVERPRSGERLRADRHRYSDDAPTRDLDRTRYGDDRSSDYRYYEPSRDDYQDRSGRTDNPLEDFRRRAERFSNGVRTLRDRFSVGADRPKSRNSSPQRYRDY